MIALTLRLEDGMHEALRREAFDRRVSINQIIRERIASGSEPQGEPSDTQVLEDFLGKLAGDRAYTLDFTSAEALHGHIVSLLKRDIAALRAAGVGGAR